MHRGAGLGGQPCPRRASMCGAWRGCEEQRQFFHETPRPAVFPQYRDRLDANLSCRSQEWGLPLSDDEEEMSFLFIFRFIGM